MKWNVWMEGFRVSGEEHGTAQYCGEWEGETFAEACAQWAAQADQGSSYPRAEFDLFDPERLAWWGCQLYDNEADARKFAG